MRNVVEKFETAQEAVGTAVAVIMVLLLIPIACALPFLWAWVYQQVWNYGVVWVVSACGGSLPIIGYWPAMGLYILVHFIRSLFTVKVKTED